MMSRRSFVCLVATVLAVAALLVMTDPASAQRRGGYGFGYSPATGLNFGYGNAYGYGNPYYGGGYYNPWQYSTGWGYSPGYSGYGWNNPGYRWSQGYYNWNTPSYSSWSTPSYYSNEGMEGAYSGTSEAGYGQGGSAYGAMSSGDMDNRIFLGVRVPANAEVWIENQKTSQTGNFRTFISPPLHEDRNFVYHIRARWTEDGRQVEKERNLEVHPGDHFFVNFMKPRPEGTARTSSGQYGASDQTGTQRENAEQGTENRTQTGTSTTNPPRTGTGKDNREQAPRSQGTTPQQPEKP